MHLTSRWWLSAVLLAAFVAQADEPAKTRLMVFTGGHGYDTKAFDKMLNELPGISWKMATHPKAHAQLKPEAAKDYDVLVLYDMPQKISEEAKADFVALLQAGKPLVAFHHCLGAYNDWDEYTNIIGGRYMHKKAKYDGVEYTPSTFKEGVDITIHPLDPAQPVTAGLGDLKVHDEVYGKVYVAKDVTPLLTTDAPGCTPTVGWTHRYGASQVVYLMQGHGPGSWNVPAWRQLLVQAIAFARDKSGAAK